MKSVIVNKGVYTTTKIVFINYGKVISTTITK